MIVLRSFLVWKDLPDFSLFLYMFDSRCDRLLSCESLFHRSAAQGPFLDVMHRISLVPSKKELFKLCIPW